MHCGALVVLHSLVTAVELNQQEGTIERAENDKVVVKMDYAGRRVRICRGKVTTIQWEVAQMNWGTPDTRRDFYEEWKNTLDRMDGEIFKLCNADIYKYLVTKVKTVVSTKRRIGGSGWAFSEAQDSDFAYGVVWADGTHGQEQPMQYPTSADERWWPCVWLREPLPHTALLPFYCPALAWSDARPWRVHPNRVRIIETTGPTFEELP